MSDVKFVPGRACGACSLCCKLLRIDEIAKPEATWCTHCAPGRGGCQIYDSRPGDCRTFNCAWLTAAEIGPEWHPEKCKMVLYVEADGQRIALHVDPARPQAWRQEPYYGQLKEWASRGVEAKRQVVIYIKDRAIVVLPGAEVDLGVMARGDQIVVSPAGNGWTASRILAKDVPPERRAKAAAWEKPARA